MSQERASDFGAGTPELDSAPREPGTPAIGRVMIAMRAESPRVVANWALRVANLPTFRAMPDLRLAEIQNAMPDVVEAVLAAAAILDSAIDPEPVTYASGVAGEHGRVRAKAGLDLGVVLVEFQQLRTELWAAVYRVVDHDPALADALRGFHQRLNYIIDTVLIAAAEAWLDASTTATR